jgi:gliding motility-associated-like protein
VDEEGRYWLRVESEESCANADTTELQEIAYPTSFDSSEITACQERVELDAGNPGASHQWNTSDTTQTLTVRTDGRYTVKIANQFCTIRDTVQVKVDVEAACPYLWVPNSFSPNDDGLNDVFKPEAQKIRDYELTIYNRWGELVFQSAKLSEGWDGTFDGKQAQTGVYLYQIVYKLRNEEGTIRLKTKEGTVQLIR